MRKALILFICLLFPLLSVANAEGSDARVYYDDGVVVESPDAGFDMKLNFQLQTRYSYQQYDEAEMFGLEDVNQISVPIARLVAQGNLLDGEVSFKIQNDFVGQSNDGRRTSDIKDVYFQWNADDAAKVRIGQFKVPFSRQELVSVTNLQFVQRSIASNEFAPGRNPGAMLLGSSGGIEYALSAHNGESEGEGINRGATDPNMLGGLMVAYSAGGYDRGYEGDPGQTDDMAFTVGAAATYEEGEVSDVDFDMLRIGGDFGIRTAGMSLQGEIYWRSLDMDGVSEKVEDLGYYAQAGYFIVPEEWEIAFRFAAVQLDEDYEDTDVFEYTGVVGYYLNGHNLKVQTGVTLEDYDFPEAHDAYDSTDLRYDLQISGYF